MKTTRDANTLKWILSLRRPHKSKGEEILNNLLIASHFSPVTANGERVAFIRTIRKADNTEYPVLWSAHSDTVHAEAKGHTQSIVFDDAEDGLLLATSDGTQPLGADDGAGVWLLLEMINAGVPGTYVVHRGEERGGIGSSAMAAHHEDFLKKFTHAIAFDRRGTTDVITHQARGRCCSDTFAEQFAALLGMGYAPCDRGIFTDTANYTTIISECSNISCGYENEHTPAEALDLQHLFALRDRLIEIFADAPTLVVERDPAEIDYGWEYDYHTYAYSKSSTGQGKKKKSAHPNDLDEFDILDMRISDIDKMVRKYPDGVADLLLEFAERLVYNLPTDTSSDETDETDPFYYSDARYKSGLY